MVVAMQDVLSQPTHDEAGLSNHSHTNNIKQKIQLVLNDDADCVSRIRFSTS